MSDVQQLVSSLERSTWKTRAKSEWGKKQDRGWTCFFLLSEPVERYSVTVPEMEL